VGRGTPLVAFGALDVAPTALPLQGATTTCGARSLGASSCLEVWLRLALMVTPSQKVAGAPYTN